MIHQELPRSVREKESCVRCRAKGIVVCPECQGTGDKRNDSYVVIGRCHRCEKETRGFVTCPNCLGMKVVDADQLRMNHRLEAERLRAGPLVWGFALPDATL